jgi:hypothetical protein
MRAPRHGVTGIGPGRHGQPSESTPAPTGQITDASSGQTPHVHVAGFHTVPKRQGGGTFTEHVHVPVVGFSVSGGVQIGGTHDDVAASHVCGGWQLGTHAHWDASQ